MYENDFQEIQIPYIFCIDIFTSNLKCIHAFEIMIPRQFKFKLRHILGEKAQETKYHSQMLLIFG